MKLLTLPDEAALGIKSTIVIGLGNITLKRPACKASERLQSQASCDWSTFFSTQRQFPQEVLFSTCCSAPT